MCGQPNTEGIIKNNNNIFVLKLLYRTDLQ